MQFNENVSLAEYSTMGLGGKATYLAEISKGEDTPEALSFAREHKLPCMMIGGGSNIVWRDEGYNGLVIVNKIKGYELRDEASSMILTIGGGEVWDEVVERSVQAGLTGIEGLSLVPGTAGATPVQNVGAYGQEISDTLIDLQAYDTRTGKLVTIKAEDCGFGYRTSRFKTVDRGRYFIVSIKLRLKNGNPKPPFYASVQKYFDENNISNYTPAEFRKAVIAIRSAKLPDPAKVRNTGSFFANPVVSQGDLARLIQQFGEVPNWPLKDGRIKLSAAWLIERAGFKDYHDKETGMATWPQQPLVLVNECAKNTADLLKFKVSLVRSIQTRFGIILEQEPELLP